MKSANKGISVLITDSTLYNDLEGFCIQRSNDCDWLIIREKQWSAEQVAGFITSLKNSVSEKNLPRIILNWNGKFEPWDIPCDGIHLGYGIAMAVEEDDALHSKLKHFRSECKMLGISVHSLEEWMAVSKLKPDYILISPILTTLCKPDAKPIGFEGLQHFCNMISDENPSVKVIALGGLKSENMPSVLSCGANGIAMRSGFNL